MPDAVGWATIIAAIIAGLALAHQIRSARRKSDAEATARADRVSFSVERGQDFQGLRNWTIRARNRGPQPVSDVRVVLGIREQGAGPIDTWPWRQPNVRVLWPSLLPEREETQDVFWEGPINDIDGPALLGAGYRDDRGQNWLRVGRGGWRRASETAADNFDPQPPGSVKSRS
jgi:hypothetical protein